MISQNMLSIFSLCPSDLHPSPCTLCTWKLKLTSMESLQPSLAVWLPLGFGQLEAPAECRVTEVFIPLVPALLGHSLLLAACLTSFWKT